MEIFKIQIPLMGESLAFIYNEDRSTKDQVPLTKELLALMGDEHKKYVWGKRRENGLLEIYSEAEEQEW